MSSVDGCVLRVCSGAKVPSWPLADWTDQMASDPALIRKSPPCRAHGVELQGCRWYR